MSTSLKRTGATLAVLAALTLAAVAALTAAPAASAATPPVATVPATLPITGTITDATGGTFTGTLSNIHFVNQNGVLAVAGTLTGTLTTALGQVLTLPAAGVPITLPIGDAQASGSCQILDLTLGPLDLDLLGLMVHLDTVHLNITAQRGAGNLLGNLLCAVAGLLDQGGGGTLATLLNQLLGL
jgi:hypothetical protein